MNVLKVSLPPEFLKEGFWLYVWRVKPPRGGDVLYVGRTGDSSSANAAAPYRRFGQHLGHVKASNALRAHLRRRNIEPESCLGFEFLAFGPLFAACASGAATPAAGGIVRGGTSPAVGGSTPTANATLHSCAAPYPSGPPTVETVFCADPSRMKAARVLRIVDGDTMHVEI